MGIKSILFLSVSFAAVSNSVLAFFVRSPLSLPTIEQIPHSGPKVIINNENRISFLNSASKRSFSPFHLSVSTAPVVEKDVVEEEASTVLVFGGSGYVGRRACKSLVSSGCNVISISRSGKPPPCYCDGDWCEAVSWISHDLNSTNSIMNDEAVAAVVPDLPSTIDAAISCVGDIQPNKEWSSFFGLSFDDDRLYRTNGLLNKNALDIAKKAGAQRFVFVSVSYEVAKFLEGPIEGYIDGKRLVEQISCELFGAEETIVIGPSLIYGGKRFPTLGKIYRAFVESFIAKAYVGGNDALRNLSRAPLEDWAEKTIFSSPVEVDIVGRVLSAAALGLVTRGMVGKRKQGFFDLQGKPIEYDDVIYVDGTKQIERVNKDIEATIVPHPTTRSKQNKDKEVGMPFAEGALIGKGPFLFPLPVIAFFLTILYCLVTNKFVTPVPVVVP